MYVCAPRSILCTRDRALIATPLKLRGYELPLSCSPVNGSVNRDQRLFESSPYRRSTQHSPCHQRRPIRLSHEPGGCSVREYASVRSDCAGGDLLHKLLRRFSRLRALAKRTGNRPASLAKRTGRSACLRLVEKISPLRGFVSQQRLPYRADGQGGVSLSVRPHPG